MLHLFSRCKRLYLRKLDNYIFCPPIKLWLSSRHMEMVRRKIHSLVPASVCSFFYWSFEFLHFISSAASRGHFVKLGLIAELYLTIFFTDFLSSKRSPSNMRKRKKINSPGVHNIPHHTVKADID